jgi:hypothetical protein
MTTPAFVDHLNAFIRGVYEGAVPRPDAVKLTAEQHATVKAASPADDRPAWQRDPLAALMAVPVVLVDSLEESTPYERGWLTAGGGD